MMPNPSDELVTTLIEQVSTLTDLLVESNERLVTLEGRVAAVEGDDEEETDEYDDPETLDEIGQFFGVKEFAKAIDNQPEIE